MPKKPAVFDAANTRLMDSTARLIKTAQSIATSPDIDSDTRKTALKVKREHKARPQGGRILTDIVVREISLCRLPVHPDARTTEVKSLEGDPMKNELENEEVSNDPAKSDPVASAEEVKALKDEIATIKAKMNRPRAANNNHPNGANDNSEKKALDAFMGGGAGDFNAVKFLKISAN